MRINNVSSRTSLQTIVWLSVILGVIIIGFIVACCFMSPAELFKMFLAIDDWYAKFWIGVLIFVLPFILVWSIISEINSRNKALELLNYGLNLRYADFRQGMIDFCFINPKYNISCSYEDIEKLKMELHTVQVRNKYGDVFIVLKEVELHFTLLNGKRFSISNTPLKPINLIYKILDYTRGVKDFSYKFSGAGVNEDIKERIDDYLSKGCRQVLSTEQENKFKWMSMLFFGLGVFTISSFIPDLSKTLAKGGDNLIFIFLVPFSIFFIIAFVLDFFLIKDKINDRKYGAEHKSTELIGKIPCELIVGLEVLIVAVIVFMVFKPLILSSSDNKVLKANGQFKELWVNPPSEFNNMRKDEILSIRKAYVKDSLFASDNYEPNERVFGAIQDYKPWWGTQKCRPLNYTGDYHESIEGESKQSIQINNPNALVGLSSPYIPWDVEANEDFCNNEYSRFLPQSIKYSEKDKLIVAEYEVSKNFPYIYVNISGEQIRYPIQLSGINALDFGYKYVYAFDTKNISMTYPNNVTENIEMFRDYIHVGGSCGYEGGCNNISPMQNDKMISVKALPAQINLKLWKKQPRDKYQKADMYYRIIFKEQ